MIRNRTIYNLLGLIVAGFLGIGILYAIKTPEWQSPDEPAHYNYVAQVAKSGCCPLIAPGDWDAAELDRLTTQGFAKADLSRIQYEDHQPPAYYLIGALVFMVTGGKLIALRLLSLVFGAGAILAVYSGLIRLLPRQSILAVSGATFVAFLPQFVAISASANNDSLSLLIISILAVVALAYLGNPVFTDHDGSIQPLDLARRPHAAALGGLMGIALITKLTLYLPAAWVVGLAILLRWRVEKQRARWLAEQAIWASVMALAFGLPWWLRNISVYGWPDVFGLRRHDVVVIGQPLTANLVNRVGMGDYLLKYVATVYHSFFGQFGWMRVPMPPRFYLGIGLFLIATGVGLILFMIRFREHLHLEPTQRAGAWLLGGLALATIAGLVIYNLRFVQFQGRYLFPMLMPVSSLIATGLWGWSLTVGGWLKGRAWQKRLAWLPLIGLAWMPPLCLWALYRFIVPHLK